MTEGYEAGYMERPEWMSNADAQQSNLSKIRITILSKNPDLTIQDNNVLVKNLSEIPFSKKTLGDDRRYWVRSDMTTCKIKHVNYATYEYKGKFYMLKMSNDSYDLIFKKIRKERNPYNKNSSNLKSCVKQLKCIIENAEIILDYNKKEYISHVVNEIEKLENIYTHNLQDLEKIYSILLSIDCENIDSKVLDPIKFIIERQIENKKLAEIAAMKKAEEEAAAKKKAVVEAKAAAAELTRLADMKKAEEEAKKEEKKRRKAERRRQQEEEDELWKEEVRKEEVRKEDEENTYTKTAAEETKIMNDVIDKFLENRKNL